MCNAERADWSEFASDVREREIDGGWDPLRKDIAMIITKIILASKVNKHSITNQKKVFRQCNIIA